MSSPRAPVSSTPRGSNVGADVPVFTPVRGNFNVDDIETIETPSNIELVPVIRNLSTPASELGTPTEQYKQILTPQEKYEPTEPNEESMELPGENRETESIAHVEDATVQKKLSFDDVDPYDIPNIDEKILIGSDTKDHTLNLDYLGPIKADGLLDDWSTPDDVITGILVVPQPTLLKDIWAMTKYVGEVYALGIVSGVLLGLMTMFKAYFPHAFHATFPRNNFNLNQLASWLYIIDFCTCTMMAMLFAWLFMSIIYGPKATKGMWTWLGIPSVLVGFGYNIGIVYASGALTAIYLAAHYLFQIYPYCIAAWYMNKYVLMNRAGYLFKAFALPLIALNIANGLFGAIFLPIFWQLEEDWMKIIGRLFIHTIIWEIVALISRLGLRLFGNSENPKAFYFIQVWIQWCSAAYGRLEIVGIKDNTLQTILVIILSLQECVWRMTSGWRDYWFHRLFYNKEDTLALMARPRHIVLKCMNIHAEMFLEVLAIVWTPFMIYYYEIPVGGSTTNIDFVLQEMGIALAIELFTDGVLGFAERRMGVPMIEVWEGVRKTRWFVRYGLLMFMAAWGWFGMIAVYVCAVKTCGDYPILHI